MVNRKEKNKTQLTITSNSIKFNKLRNKTKKKNLQIIIKTTNCETKFNLKNDGQFLLLLLSL